jgi:hypothetical protein
MILSRLNGQGIAKFVEWLNDQRSGFLSEPPMWLLTDEAYTENLSGNVDIQAVPLPTRWDAGKLLYESLTAAKLADNPIDPGLWTWLTLAFIESVCPKGAKGLRKIGEQARYIPEPQNFQRYYRHLLAGPFLVYRAHSDSPERARCLLVQELHKPGDIVEQLAARQQILTNRSVVEVATRLYVSADGSRKHGAAGSGRGSPRRLASVLRQYDLTWDLYATPPDELYALLPKEFDRFKK